MRLLSASEQEAGRGGEERFRLLENVKDYAIFMLDINGYVLSWNVGAENSRGYRAEIIGQHSLAFRKTLL